MIIIRSVALLFLMAGLTACANMWGDKEIALSEVPAAAVAAAEGAVDGFQIKSAEIEDKDGRTVYELEGKANGVKHEVQVTADGQVLKAKAEH